MSKRTQERNAWFSKVGRIKGFFQREVRVKTMREFVRMCIDEEERKNAKEKKEKENNVLSETKGE